MKITFDAVRAFIIEDKKQPIRDSKSYKEAIKRATAWQTLLAEEEKRIIEYFSFKRTHSKSTA
jgi:hypothetical protein